MKQTGARSLSH